MQYALLAASLLAACCSLCASRISQAAGIAGSTQSGIRENQQFNQLIPNSPCKADQMACAEGKFAQCGSGKFITTPCAGELQCFSLPLVNQPGTSVTCTTPVDAARRMNAASVQELQALVGGVSAVPPVGTGTGAAPVGTGMAGPVGTSIPKKPIAETNKSPSQTAPVPEASPAAETSVSSPAIAQPTTTKDSPAKPTAVQPRASSDFQEPSAGALKARIPQLVKDAVPAPPVSTFVGDVICAPYASHTVGHLSAEFDFIADEAYEMGFFLTPCLIN